MAKVVNLPPGVLLSIRQFSDECGQDRDTVGKRVKAAGIQPAASRGGHPVYRLRDLLKAAIVTSEDGVVDPDKLDPFKRRAFYQGELDKLKLATERGELVPRAEVERQFAGMFTLAAQAFDTMPDILERDCGATAMQLRKIEQTLDAVREALYERLQGEDGDADRPARIGA